MHVDEVVNAFLNVKETTSQTNPAWLARKTNRMFLCSATFPCDKKIVIKQSRISIDG